MSLMLAFVWIYQHTELPDSVNAFLDRQASIVYYADGKTELTRLGETNREEINIADMPLHLREAVIAAENKTFYTDKGFSPTGIARAVINNLRGGDVQGGSTITQQYAKLAFTNQEPTLSRKVEELFLSMKLEETYTKDQILQDYLNAVYLGRGAYGVQAAAKVYFNKQAKELSVEEAAVLAAVLRSPEGLYSPDKSEQSMQALQARWGWVLDQMVETGALAADARAPMVFPEIAKYESRNRRAGPRGYLIAQVERELRAAGVSDEVIQNGGLRIQTTINPNLQKAAEAAVKENRQKENADNIHIALVAVEPGTGAIRASYGGADFLKDNVDDAFQAQIPPGSAFKAFGIAAALSDANNLSLEGNALDGNSPYRFRDDSDPVDNCCDGSGSDYGQVSILEATERSINTAFVDLATKLLDGGTKDVVDAAHAAGITTDLVANARTVIGYQDVQVVEMANAYATFAAGGVAAPAHIIEKATYADGSPVDLGRPEPTRAFTDVQAAGVQYALRQPVEGDRGTSVKARDLGRPVAGKTGTHQDFSAWFVGFTPNQLAAAVAIYRDDRNTANDKESLDGYGGRNSVTGNSFPLDTWLTFMQTVLKDQPVTDFLPYDDSGRDVVNSFPAQEPSATSWEPPGHNKPPDPPGND